MSEQTPMAKETDAGDPFAELDAGRPAWDALGAFVPAPQPSIAGKNVGPLAGLRFAAKDIFDVAGFVTGCGNPDWAASHAAAEGHATAVEALLEAGAELVGKTITDELAFSLNGQNFHYGTPTNVNAPGRICGGSSSGSAAAVAGGLADTALGSDTGGSIRIPASYCGLFGLRPTHGRLSLKGVMPLAPSFDTVGWFARDAEVLRRVGGVLFGQAANATKVGQAADAAKVGQAADAAKVGSAARWRRLLIATDAFDLAVPAARDALAPLVERLEQRIAPGREVLLMPEGDSLEAWMWRFRHIQAREIMASHGDWIAAAKPRFGPESQERFTWAAGITEADAAPARAQRKELTKSLTALLGDDALICLPAAPGIAPRCDSTAEALKAHRSAVLGLTCVAGLAGLPQISLPLARVEGCPLGLSLIAPAGADEDLLAFAEEFCATAEDRPDL